MNIFHSLSILGPTASGKSTLAIELAKQINGEIIGLDSRQIYKFFEIGTAQPSKDELEEIPHHLIGIKDPKDHITAGSYAKLVRECIKDICNRKKIPIICGGSGLYYRAISKGIFEDSSSSLEIRSKLEKEYDDLGSDKLLDRLKSIDSEYSKIIHPNNKKRLIRALEIFELTGKSPTEHFNNQKKVTNYKYYSIYLEWDKAALSKRIIKRTKKMIDSGWIEEVRRLVDRFSKNKIPPIDSIGYREICNYIENDINLERLIFDISTKTQRLSTKQVKWFKNETLDLVLNMPDFIKTDQAVNFIIKNIPKSNFSI